MKVDEHRADPLIFGYVVCVGTRCLRVKVEIEENGRAILKVLVGDFNGSGGRKGSHAGVQWREIYKDR